MQGGRREGDAVGWGGADRAGRLALCAPRDTLETWSRARRVRGSRASLPARVFIEGVASLPAGCAGLCASGNRSTFFEKDIPWRLWGAPVESRLLSFGLHIFGVLPTTAPYRKTSLSTLAVRLLYETAIHSSFLNSQLPQSAHFVTIHTLRTAHGCANSSTSQHANSSQVNYSCSNTTGNHTTPQN